jgi:hypothetical protein
MQKKYDTYDSFFERTQKDIEKVLIKMSYQLSEIWKELVQLNF